VTADGSQVRITASWDELQERGVEVPFHWSASLNEMDVTQGPQSRAWDSCPDIDRDEGRPLPVDELPLDE
jgi:hypothetical protein